MVRVAANLLLAVFSLGLIAPAFNSSPEAKLPPCCRRDGQHHCAMSAAAGLPVDGVTFSAAKQKCPLYPKLQLHGAGKVFIPEASAAYAAPHDVHCLVERLANWPALRVGKANLQRGPPIPKALIFPGRCVYLDIALSQHA